MYIFYPELFNCCLDKKSKGFELKDLAAGINASTLVLTLVADSKAIL